MKKEERTEEKILWVKGDDVPGSPAMPAGEALTEGKPLLLTMGEGAGPSAAEPEAIPAPSETPNAESEAGPVPKAADVPAAETLPAAAIVMKPPRRRGPVGSFFRTIGNLFYTLGLGAEYIAVLFWRVARDVLSLVWQVLALAGGRLWEGLKSLARSIWKDITGPFVQFRRRRQLLRRVRERARRRGTEGAPTYRGVQVKTTAQLVAWITSFLLPVAAAAALVFTVHNVMSMNYALAVEHNGQVLGYVADQSVVEGAKDLLRDRIRLAENQELSDWQLTPNYAIASTREFTTTRQLVNEILLTSTHEEGDIVPATGLYIDDTLFAVTTEGGKLQEYLDGLLLEQERQVDEMAEVSFVRPVVCEPDNDDLYFASSVEDLDELIGRLSENTMSERRVSTDGASTLETIAHDNGLTLDVLLERNPGLAETAETVAAEEEITPGEYVPEAGGEVLINHAEPFLQVQTCVRERSEEPIPFGQIEEENPELLQNTRHTTQDGADGTMEVWDDVYYVDGEVDRRERVEELTRVLVEPVPEIIEVGTLEVAAAPDMPAGGYGAGYIFPVPNSPYSGRGMSATHGGYDINAPAGSPIYAIQGGYVTTAGWHWSYGNYIMIDHGGGVVSLYAHCSALYVSAGQAVGQGQNIAAVGNTGYSFGNHLHLEMQINGSRVDPMPYVGYPY